jgi:uncharacterized protein
MTINEHSLWLHGNGFDMLGIVSLPPDPMPMQSTGVVIVVGGAQYRTGSHRQFLQLARFLAAAGFPVLRFDFPGMGDSPGEPPSFEETAPHIAAAIDGFQQRHPGVERVVLWGLCDGASASLLYVDATHDPRIAGLALLNPWVRSEVSLARARVKHYYWQRLQEPVFWRKLFSGGIGFAAANALRRNIAAMAGKRTATQSFQERMARGWKSLPQPKLLLLSDLDITAQEFTEEFHHSDMWSHRSIKDGLTLRTIKAADHTCSSKAALNEVNLVSGAWLARLQNSSASR